MKGITNGLFNNLDCTFNSTFKNLFQKGLKIYKNTYSSLNRCFVPKKQLDWETSDSWKPDGSFYVP